MIWEQVGYAIIDNLKCGMPLVVGFCQTDWQAAAEAERLKGEVPASVYNDMQVVSAVLTFGDKIKASGRRDKAAFAAPDGCKDSEVSP